MTIQSFIETATLNCNSQNKKIKVLSFLTITNHMSNMVVGRLFSGGALIDVPKIFFGHQWHVVLQWRIKLIFQMKHPIFY